MCPSNCWYEVNCASASSSGLPENSGLTFDQFKCTNDCPCGACRICGACGTCGACGAYGACGTAGPAGSAGVEGLEHLALDLLYLTYIISNLCFNYDSSIIVLFYSPRVTLLPCFYFISCPLFTLVTFIYSLSLLPSFTSIYINSSLFVTIC